MQTQVWEKDQGKVEEAYGCEKIVIGPCELLKTSSNKHGRVLNGSKRSGTNDFNPAFFLSC